MTGWAVFTGALWLGILTSISPCPLASNIAAISFISKDIDRKWRVLLNGLLYALGRSLSYAIVGYLVVKAAVNIPLLSDLLQRYMNQLIGPLLILTGIILLGMLKIDFASIGFSQKTSEKISRWGFLGSFLLGSLFALAFCPVSAALFFGSLIPLAIQSDMPILLPSLFGIGTAVPVFGFAVLILGGMNAVSRVFKSTTKLEYYVKILTGIVLIVVGIYESLVYIFRIL